MNTANIHVGVRIFVAGKPAPAMWRMRLLGRVARLLRVPLDTECVAAVQRIDGQPMVTGPDGLVHGDRL